MPLSQHASLLCARDGAGDGDGLHVGYGDGIDGLCVAMQFLQRIIITDLLQNIS